MKDIFQIISNASVKAKLFILVVIAGLIVFINKDQDPISVRRICTNIGVCSSVKKCNVFSCGERADGEIAFSVRQFKQLLKQNQSSASTCAKLFSKGSYFKYDDWRPEGCTLHMYTQQDVLSCIHRPNNNTMKPLIVFMGDSRMRRLYYEFIAFIKEIDDSRPVRRDQTFKYVNHDIAVEFKWCSYVYQMKADIIRWNSLQSNQRPVILLLSAGTWHMNNLTVSKEVGLKSYINDITAIRPLLNTMSETTLSMWILQEDIDEEKHKAHKKKKTGLSNKLYGVYNTAAVSILHSSSVFIWSSARSISYGFLNESFDGVHMPYRAKYWHCQLLYNMFCNDYTDHNDATCCKYTEKTLF